jgi:hypothetical protein
MINCEHVWIYEGGTGCGCEDGCCSVPLCKCEKCGDYDYGDNEERIEIKARCDAMMLEYRKEEMEMLLRRI